MIKRLIMVLGMTLLFQGVSIADESLSTILEGIQKTYGPLPGLSVPYTREVITRSMSMLGGQASGDTASGTIYFRHPHFLRLEQEKPKPETIIANEDTLWWYIPDKKSAYRYPANEFGKELRLLSDIFRGLAQVETSFQVVLQNQGPSGEHEIELIPDPPWQEIDRIAVTANRQYRIQSIRIHNALGTTTRFTLGALSEKKDFEEGFFRFVAPKGVELIVEGAGQ
ncbi:MAG: outer membrane lipoprotein carrier protein LolA [Candidatus Desulfacyla sp.]